MLIKKIIFLFILGTIHNLYGQKSDFSITIEPLNINGLGGLQAYAFGQHNGKWLIIGGRLDGLHRRQPFAAFDAAGHNNQLIVVDPITKQKWSAPLSTLTTGLKEQLSSTNMQFHQEKDMLYLIGGYGYSATAADHITYPNLSAVKVSEVINAIINNQAYNTFFRQITDTMFEVTGGYLNKIYDTYHLTGGQKFIGRYNPMGPNNGPGFIQQYTNAIRRFTISDNGTTISITHLTTLKDANELHRRDYNVVPQIMPNGQEGLTAFSGVFKTDVDLPFLNCVNIDSNGFTINNAFSQFYNQYHCAHIPLYNSTKNEMHTLFFGGIAQFYDSAGILIQDNNVPFVKTISRVTRTSNGVMTEYKLPIDMPALLGASSEFILNEGIATYANDVIRFDSLINDTTEIGYIYGGINSSAPNIFFTNTGTQSSASSQLFKVSIIKNNTSSIDQLNNQSKGAFKMQIFPNPSDSELTISFNINHIETTTITITDVNGKTIEQSEINHPNIGHTIYKTKIQKGNRVGIYFITIENSKEKSTQKVIINP